MPRIRSPLLRLLACGLLCAALPVSAWAQHRGEHAHGIGFPPHPSVASLPEAWPRPDVRAGIPVMPRNGRAAVAACINEVPRDPDDQVLSVQPIDFGGRVQCRVKVMRSDGMVQVLTGELP